MKMPWFVAFLSMVGIACSPTTYTNGVPNLAQVDQTKNIWRSGQPATLESWKYIKSLGVKSVVKLNFDEEGNDEGAMAMGIDVLYVPIEPKGDVVSVVKGPDPANIARAVQALMRPDTLVHCTHGEDRTGAVVGALRVVGYGWKKSRAWQEMLAHHFHPELPALMLWWLDFDGQWPSGQVSPEP
jgi:hypothetical protein